MRKLTVILLSGIICLVGLIPVLAYNEAPMLKALVDTGELPYVEERLPQEPVVIGPGTLMPKEYLDFQIGKYGGSFIGVENSFDLALREVLFLTSNLSSEITSGNIIQDFSVNDDSTVFTFHLRKGLKWSDGYSVTTEDVSFVWEDVLRNKELYPVIPLRFRTGAKSDGELMKLEIVDNYTFRISFSEPYGGFIDQIMQNEFVGYYDLIKPKHYLKRFHIKYTAKEEMKPYLEEEKVDEWYELFQIKDIRFWDADTPRAIGFPTLNPWIVVKSPPGMQVLVRNPYYFAVDPEGNQLPYIDKIIGLEVADSEAASLMVMAGEIDQYGTPALAKLPIFKEKEKKGNYRTILNDGPGARAFWLNLTYEDPVWREIVRDIRFRKAINMGINRQEIINELYYEIADIPKVVPSEYNAAKANRLLDEMGLDKRDKEGYRLRSDGKTLEIFIEIGDYFEYINTAPLIVEQLKALGVKASFKILAWSLWGEKWAGNELQFTINWNRANTWRNRLNHDYFFSNNWAPLWATWYETAGKQGEKPPDWTKKLIEIREEIMKVVPGSPEDKKAMDELYSWYYRNIPNFTYLESPKLLFVVSNKFGNIPTDGYSHAVGRCFKITFHK